VCVGISTHARQQTVKVLDYILHEFSAWYATAIPRHISDDETGGQVAGTGPTSRNHLNRKRRKIPMKTTELMCQSAYLHNPNGWNKYNYKHNETLEEVRRTRYSFGIVTQ
jgi:hypothetical protein